MTTLPFMSFAAGFVVATLANGVRSVFRSVARAWRWRRSQAQFNELDAHALRDLGLHRSEFLSFCAESERLAPITRRRVALAAEQPVHGKPVKAIEVAQVGEPERRGARHARAHVCGECGKSRSCGHHLRALRSHRKLVAGAHVAARP